MGKARNIITITTGFIIIGFTIYSIKKYYDAKKQDEQSIGLDEARAIVEEDDRLAYDVEYVETHAYYETLAHYDPNFKRKNGELTDEQMGALVDDARDQACWDSSFMTPGASSSEKIPIGKKPSEVEYSPILEEEEEEEEEWFEGPDPQEIQDGKQYFAEDKDVIDDLRYEPNSVEAREQFINMELANLGRSNDTRDVVDMLYDHPFTPTCDEDLNLKTRLIEHRINFFGMVSRWTKEVTFGDLVMYYGKAAEYNCGNDVLYWVDYFLTCANLNDLSVTSDMIDERINQLNIHKFYNEDTQSYGLFGLTDDQMHEAAKVAQNRIDEKMTYDIEFGVFMQGVI